MVQLLSEYKLKNQNISNFNSNNISLVMGPNAHLVVYPINQNNELNLVCIVRKKLENNEDIKQILIIQFLKKIKI